MNQRAIDPSVIMPGAHLFKVPGEKKAAVFILKNGHGICAAVTNFDGSLLSLLAPDAAGRLVELITPCSQPNGINELAADVLYYKKITRKDQLSEKDHHKFLANRLALVRNAKPDLKQPLWTARQKDGASIEFTRFVTGGGDGFSPGSVERIQYTLTDDNRLKISYELPVAQVGAQPFPGLYFNLNGPGSGTVLGHLLHINAGNFMPVNAARQMTGDIEDVSGTPFDFRKATIIGARINDNNEQLSNANGYDHIFALNKHSSRTPVARVKGDKTGIIMEVCTEEAGLRFCTCNEGFSKGNDKDNVRTAFCLEAVSLPGIMDPGQDPDLLSGEAKTHRFVTVLQLKR